jgi:hypothetical protein
VAALAADPVAAKKKKFKFFRVYRYFKLIYISFYVTLGLGRVSALFFVYLWGGFGRFINRKEKNMINYGLPYQGSKSAIAPWVISCLPPGDTLVDLFCGGCAVTDAAIRSHRYKRFIFNDINPMMPSAYLKALNGGFKDEDRWISREDFFWLKDKDAYVALCFSFGNHLRTYAYSPTNELYKKAFHYAVVFNDWGALRELRPEVADAAYQALEHIHDRHERRLKFRQVVVRRLKEIGDAGLIDSNPLYTSCHTKKQNGIRPVGTVRDLKSLQSLEHLESLQRLERLQSLQSLESHNRPLLWPFVRDYRKVPIPEGAVVYCDPPYKNTFKYLVDFDHEAFYHWALTRDYPVFISEYAMPDEFAPIAIKQKTCSMNDSATNIVAEKIFVQRRYADKYKRDLFL